MALSYEQDPIAVSITPDFTSFLRDVEAQRLQRKELAARLQAKNGYADVGPSYYYDVREDRSVSPEQANIVLREYDTREQIRQDAAQARDYTSYYGGDY